ncbi:uncharacterized protein LOC106155521 [Lingula anatina]|uniref:Uncharacterized protein LOC106155521 n=1 Tax=Lingula anatina TaxID=7574 RepID=A0A2R2MR94_LINAN|nr:uncharacterized protein LOC106155521 [Lingula anatina]|eukprot:XP_023932771.1 uncharacterized protein LOC106155521 [Lingula anatina]
MQTILLVLLVGVGLALGAKTTQAPRVITDQSQQNEIDDLKRIVSTLGRQLMMQQLFVEERVRSDGASGLKQIRLQEIGTRPYHAETYVGNSMASLHDHANYDRTVGLGEFIAVLNGVEFRTRHNDYKLRMPSRTSSAYHATEDIPFPGVPPEVTKLSSIQEQINEMKEWFKAWWSQDKSKRDYTKYFKPVLCFLEGAWTYSDGSLEESFESDRHFIDAASWFDLHEKTRFTSYAGRKSNLENFAYLPTTIMEMINGSVPRLAQWNYRILCHPLSKDIPFSRFRLVDDLHNRVARGATMEKQRGTRRARFQLNPSLVLDAWGSSEFSQSPDFLDSLMEEIPGWDNYKGVLNDTLDDDTAWSLNEDKPVNTAYYHRWFNSLKEGAMGINRRHRGFSDNNVFMAQTTQPNVAGLSYTHCHRKVCKTFHQKWTYAIPLEIVYLTPLQSWNPYNLQHKGDYKSTLGKTVYDGPNGTRRNGLMTKAEAFNGINTKAYYITPHAFFDKTGTSPRDPADTTRAAVGVLDRKGVLRAMTASGPRVFLNIPDVGEVRLRWPIAPVHNDGNVIFKELEALKDMVMEQGKYMGLYRTSPVGDGNSTGSVTPMTGNLELVTGPGTKDPPGDHVHTLRINPTDAAALQSGKKVTVRTSTDQGHSHVLRLKYDAAKKTYMINRCDGKPACWDGHPLQLNMT